MASDVSVDNPLNALAATLDPSIRPDPFTNPPSTVDIEKLDFLKTRALRNSIHLRERGHCFYCLRRLDALTAGKLPPPVHHPDTPIGIPAHHTKPVIPSDARNHSAPSSASSPGKFIGRKGRPRRALPV